MAVRDILLLGNPLLYQPCQPVEKKELPAMQEVIRDLHDTLMAFREKNGVGRGIAAPQIGVMKRLIYLHIDRPMVIVNPLLDQKSPQMMELWDDCMSFPDLLVRVERHRSCRLAYRNAEWQEKVLLLDGLMAELIQHEYDHLDGILAVMRAVDIYSLALKSQRHHTVPRAPAEPA